jgi:hypothetical protein
MISVGLKITLTLGGILLAAWSSSAAAPVEWRVADGGNGHLYEVILVPGGITWTDANAAAQSRGPGWHLAAITSAAEDAFVAGLVNNPAPWLCCVSGNSSGPWIGGYWVVPE